MTANAANRLIAHYVDNFRDLPWRAAPGEPAPDPYRVWLSEVMLQQTSVAAVVPRFERFVRRWTTLDSLAAAADEEILAEWAGLGYYARARNLIACARQVTALGGFPTSEEELRRLPGIGDYTAAAIGAIAFGRRAAAVDTNVLRVTARLYGLKQPARQQVRALVWDMVPAERPGEFTQAMMDLGATICRPRAPDCPACPLRPDCAAFASGSPESFPAAKTKRIRPLRHGAAEWIEREGHVWLVRRPSKGLLGGMPGLPSGDWTETAAPAPGPALARVQHVFTHFALDLMIVEGGEPSSDGWWQPLDRLAEAGLPTLFRKAAELVLASRAFGVRGLTSAA